MVESIFAIPPYPNTVQMSQFTILLGEDP